MVGLVLEISRLRWLKRLGQPLLVAAMVLLAYGTNEPVAAIINGSEPEPDDRRFDAIGAFSRTSWLQLGGREQPDHVHNWFGAATLVAPDRILTARHLVDRTAAKPGRSAIRFRRRLDGGLGSVQEGPDSFYHATVIRWTISPTADLALGQLSRPVQHIKPMALALSTDPIEVRRGFVAAWGSESNWIGVPNPRTRLMIGENRLTSVASTNLIRLVDGQFELRNWRKDKQTGQWKQRRFVTTDAALPNKHDSGGAILVESDRGQLQLIGVITQYQVGVWLAPLGESAQFPLSDLIPSLRGKSVQP